MILVDTSIWIRFFSNQPGYADRLDALLERDEVVSHELVYGELLIGDRGGRTKFLASYEKIHRAPTIPHGEVVEFVRGRRLHGRGAGWVDIHLLASAVVAGFPLWTADPRLDAIARELGIAWKTAGAA